MIVILLIKSQDAPNEYGQNPWSNESNQDKLDTQDFEYTSDPFSTSSTNSPQDKYHRNNVTNIDFNKR